MMPLVGPSLSTASFTSLTLPPFVASPSSLFVRRRRGGGLPRINVSIEPPPVGYDFRAETRQETVAIIRELYPDLSDLVEEGDMLVIKRPLDYVERRSDGYVEPELIFLFGTSHVSSDSAANVERVLNAVRPENVVVELCRSRAGIMYSGEPAKSVKGQPAENQETNLFSIGGVSFLSAMGRSLNLGGQSALALRLLLAGFSQKISSSIGTPIGDEKLKTDDSMSTMFKELSMFYPSLLQPLIHERDYLAWSLKRSKAVNGSKKVVGIIGRGHMCGVVHALKHDHSHLRFRDLVGGRRPNNDNMKDWVRSLVSGFIRDTLITIIVLWFVEHQY